MVYLMAGLLRTHPAVSAFFAIQNMRLPYMLCRAMHSNTSDEEFKGMSNLHHIGYAD